MFTDKFNFEIIVVTCMTMHVIREGEREGGAVKVIVRVCVCISYAHIT